jgi:hypothetical protein
MSMKVDASSRSRKSDQNSETIKNIGKVVISDQRTKRFKKA